MDRFTAVFGIEKEKIEKNCLLLPFLPAGVLKEFGVKELNQGAVYSSASVKGLTVIKTGIGANFVGDAVLYLAKASCENIFFLGSCGLINNKLGLRLGDLVFPTVAYPFESFTDILTQRIQKPLGSYPDSGLMSDFLETTGLDLHRSACVSFSSLYQEEGFIPVFQRLGADVIEMECAALFHAARKAEKKALALLYISDIPSSKPLYQTPSPEDKKSLIEGTRQACAAIQKFVSET
jgi:purine-nucleoside phosphorylase